jgi:hypothetical protein
MMTDKELDDLFKNTFANHEAPIPAGMWQRIQPGGAKKRPLVLWWKWYAIAAVFLIAGAATWWYADNGGTTNKKALSYNTSSNTKNNPQTTQNTGDTGAKNDTNGYLQQNKSSDQLKASLNKSTITNKQQLAISQAGNKKESHSNNIHLNSSGSNNQNTTDLNASALGAKHDAQANITKEHNYSIGGLNNNADLAQAQTSSGSTKGNQNTGAPPNNSIAKQNSTANNTTNINNTVASNTKKGNKKKKHPWTLEVLGTTAYADKQTYDVVKENPIFAAAPVPPSQPKPTLWNFGTGVRLGIPVSKHFTLKTGLQFAQTLQNADYQQQNVVDMISVRGGDTSFYRQIVYETEKQRSTYNALSVPVLISYQTGKKIQVGATAGVIVNAYSWYTGKVPNADYTTTLEAKDTYKHNTGAAVYAGITVAKKIGAVELFAEPHLQYSLSSFTKPTVPFKQKINTYGLSIGVRTRLHK